MPSRKDVKSVKQVVYKRVPVQKRLLLLNIGDNHEFMKKQCISCPLSHVLRKDFLKCLNNRNSITFNQ
jgi:predicted protein tyrosine phosphatase